MKDKINPTGTPDLTNFRAPEIVTFDDAELANMDPAEQEVARRMNQLAAEGIDPTLDDEEIAQIRAVREQGQATAAAEIAAQPDPNAKPEPQDQTANAAPVAQPEIEAEDLPVLAPVANIAELDQSRQDLRKKERDLLKQWTDGEIEQDDYDKQVTELHTQIDRVSDDIATARATHQQNELQVAAHQRQTLDAIKLRGADIGIDYNAKDTVDAFNSAMDLVASLPANAALSFAQLAEKAHAMVAAMNGVQAAPAPAPAPTPAPTPTPTQQRPAPRTAPPLPKTLARVPAAEIPNQGSQAQDLGEAIFGGKNAAQQEEAWEKLTQAQKAALLGDAA